MLENAENSEELTELLNTRVGLFKENEAIIRLGQYVINREKYLTRGGGFKGVEKEKIEEEKQILEVFTEHWERALADNSEKILLIGGTVPPELESFA